MYKVHPFVPLKKAGNKPTKYGDYIKLQRRIGFVFILILSK